MATTQEICSKPTPTSQISKKTEAMISSTGMSEVEEENGRLKLVVSKMMKDCNSPQLRIDHDMIITSDKNNVTKYASDREDDLNVVLSLGRSSSILLEAKIKGQREVIKKGAQLDDNLKENQELVLCLNCNSSAYHHQTTTGLLKNDESAGKSDQGEETSTYQTWPPSIDLRRSRTGEDDENPPKKARVSVRAICNAPTMNDGCQWRKYGQKTAKGNPCPRAYYRCTISPSCPVRKHVQRCPENKSILVTTYEGLHDHPLPPSATAMASTTSAAVSMLKSSSSTSTSQPSFSLPSTTSNLHINNKLHFVSPPFYFPNTTMSTSQIHPTVTLDLTAPCSSSQYNKYASTFLPQSPAYNSPTNCLNFSAASSSLSSFEYWNSLPNRITSLLSYNDIRLLLPQSQTQMYQPHYNMATRKTYDQALEPLFSTDKIAAATREITSNPSFQSALAAAISSIVGKTGTQRMEPPSDFGFATTYLNRPSTVVPSNSQAPAGNLKFELPFASNRGPSVAGPSAEKGQYKK